MALTAIELTLARPHRRVEGVAGTEGLTASLAGTVPRVEGVGATRVGLDGALVVGVSSRFPTAKLPTW